MLKVLLHHNEDVIDNNDLFFSKYTATEVTSLTERGKQLRTIIMDLEPVKFTCSSLSLCRSTLTGDTISIGKISTGIKTLMNILTYPSTVFNITECGFNILQKLFFLKEGFIYMTFPVSAYNCGNKFIGVLDDKSETQPMSMEELVRWIQDDRAATWDL